MVSGGCGWFQVVYCFSSYDTHIYFLLTVAYFEMNKKDANTGHTVVKINTNRQNDPSKLFLQH